MTWPHATKGLRNADTGELAAIRDAAMALIEHERLISPRVLTDLCLIREEAIAELRNRVQPVRADSQAS